MLPIFLRETFQFAHQPEECHLPTHITMDRVFLVCFVVVVVVVLLFMKLSAGVDQWDRISDRSTSGVGKTNQDCPKIQLLLVLPYTTILSKSRAEMIMLQMVISHL